MSTDPQYPPVPTPPGQPPVLPAEPAKPARNTVGLIALISAAVGFVFACIPGALIVGWILLPVGFVLGVVSLFQNKPKKLGTWAIIVSIVGTIVGVIVFLSVVSSAVDDALGGETTVVTPTETDDAESPSPDATEEGTGASEEEASEVASESATESAEAAAGTRENPVPIGSTIIGPDWEVTVTSFDPDANEAVLAANQFNDPPAEGFVYALVGVSATYTGEDSGSAMFDVSVDYVTASGEVITGTESLAVTPDPRFGMTEVYAGGTDAGNVLLEIPADGGGVLRVTPGFLSDPVFVATG